MDATIANLLPRDKILAAIIYNTVLWTLAILCALLFLSTCAGCTIKELLHNQIPLKNDNHRTSIEVRSCKNGEKEGGEEGEGGDREGDEVVVLKTFREVYGKSGVRDLDDVVVMDPDSADEGEEIDEKEAPRKLERVREAYVRPRCETDDEGEER